MWKNKSSSVQQQLVLQHELSQLASHHARDMRGVTNTHREFVSEKAKDGERLVGRLFLLWGGWGKNERESSLYPR
jgi:hypothetical protein